MKKVDTRRMPPIDTLIKKYKITKGTGFYTYCDTLHDACFVIMEELESQPADRLTIETVYFEKEEDFVNAST
jgi:hypothetical protein